MKVARWLHSVGLVVLVLAAAMPSAAQSIEDLKKGVVKITAQAEGKIKVGTGFIVRLETDRVYVLTAAHVVEGDPKPLLTFYRQQDAQYPATVRNAEGNAEGGLAILVAKLPPAALTGIAALALDTTTKLSGGEAMLTIGFPRTGGQWAVIKGDVTSREGRILNLDANIQEGNSGGPIIHGGKVVGLVTARGSNYGSGVTAASAHDYLEGFNVTPHAGSAHEPVASPSAPVPREAVQQPKKDFATQMRGKDGAPMLLVPAGEFMMGSRENDKSAQNDERPAHPVYLDAFYIDQYEVTTSHYATFFQETNRAEPKYWSEQVLKQHGGKPVVGVNWHDATAYCAWGGKRLPTEAEWEKAARGTDQRIYPWGNQPPSEQRANFNRCCDFKDYGVLTDVGSYEQGKSPYSVYEMAGNVWEWTADWYDENYYGKSPERNPKGPSSGEFRVLRGGSWFNAPDLVRSAHRDRLIPSLRNVNFGFRCAQDVPK